RRGRARPRRASQHPSTQSPTQQGRSPVNVRLRRIDHVVATVLLTALILSGWLVIPQAQPTALAAGTPTPVASLAVPPDPFIGENFTFTVTFDNTDATATGYGPFVDLYLPARGADG